MNYQHVEILLVEDSTADAEMTMRTLKRRGIANNVTGSRRRRGARLPVLRGATTPAAPNGDPTLVLLDLKMPRMDGWRCCERMKADARTRTIPVVMLTSSREESDLIASYGSGSTPTW